MTFCPGSVLGILACKRIRAAPQTSAFDIHGAEPNRPQVDDVDDIAGGVELDVLNIGREFRLEREVAVAGLVAIRLRRTQLANGVK